MNFDQLLREAELAHGHLYPGQVLGVRMAMLGLEMLGIDDPKRKEAWLECERRRMDKRG
jgi:formylmethanofuran dehydrogenase subunit E